MDIRKIKKLIELVEESGIAELEISEGEESVRINRYSNQAAPAAPVQYAAAPAPAAPVAAPAAAEPAAPAAAPVETGHKVLSPMVGTFFLQDSKELTEPQIKVGDKIEKGDVIGFIEAMKVMNEVTSDIAGEVANIAVEHGTNVEYDQILVTLK